MAVADESVAGRTWTPVRRLLARGARRLRHGRPKLSIVVLAAGGDPGRVDDLLASVRNQPSPAIELIVVGPPEELAAARAAGASDTRSRFVRASTFAAARALGVRRSRGEFVLVASPGDNYPRAALSDLLPALVANEILVLSDAVADPDHTDLARQPEVARAPYLGRLVLPRSRARGLSQGAAEDPDAMVAALAALRNGFSTTPYPAWRDVRAAKPGPFTVRVNPLPRLATQIAADRAALGILADLPAARAQRALGALVGLVPFLEATEVASAEDWAVLVTHARTLRELAADQLEELPVVPRVQTILAADGRRADLVKLVATRQQDADDFATEVLDGRVIADLGIPLPAEALVVGEEQSSLAAQVRRLYLDGRTLVLEVLAGIRLVDQIEPPVVGAWLVSGAGRVPFAVVTGSDPAVTRWFAEPGHDHDAGLVTLRVDAADLTPGAWQIELDWFDGALRRTGLVQEISHQGSAAREVLDLDSTRAVRLRARHGRVALVVTAPAAAEPDGNLTRVEPTGLELRLTADRSIDQVWLEGQGVRVDGVPGTSGFWTVPLSSDEWRLGTHPLATGGYRLMFSAAGKPVPVVPGPGLVDVLPAEWRTEHHRIQLLRADRSVLVRLDPVLADDEIGVRAQRRLQIEHARVTDRLDDRLVYFQSFTGQSAGDHPLAIQAELVRHRSDLDVRWLVADSSAPVPPGSEAVLYRSRAWYDVMTRASYVVTNIELERWFARRPGQQILQTFHGYPSKAMGLGLWQPRGLLPSQVESQLDHTSRTWNALLTPSPEMDQYYRRDYAYEGRILPLGYPRNDVLVGPGRSELRARTRERLGIAEHQRVILYAPTWRDDLATNFRAAQAVHHLDVERAAAVLGEDYVLLLRGHRFHQPADATGSRVIDVTAYPDVNHLILASDAAVLDYSSLRFDFALVERPMVFLVPDLDSYGSRTRGFLWDYRETAPGPLVSTTAEVVSELRDIEALAGRWAAEQVAFNARYNQLQDGHAAERVVADFFKPLL